MSFESPARASSGCTHNPVGLGRRASRAGGSRRSATTHASSRPAVGRGWLGGAASPLLGYLLLGSSLGQPKTPVRPWDKLRRCASRSSSRTVTAGPRCSTPAREAEAAGVDRVMLPDHLAYGLESGAQGIQDHASQL